MKTFDKNKAVKDLAETMQDASKKDSEVVSTGTQEESVAHFGGVLSRNMWGMVASKLIDYIEDMVRGILAEWMAEQDKKAADKK